MKHKAFRWIPAVLLAALLAGCGAETATPASAAAPASVSAAASTPEDRPAQKKPGADGRRTEQTVAEPPALPEDWEQQVLAEWMAVTAVTQGESYVPADRNESFTLRLEKAEITGTVTVSFIRETYVSPQIQSAAETRTGELNAGAITRWDGEKSQDWNLTSLSEDGRSRWTISMMEDGSLRMQSTGPKKGSEVWYVFQRTEAWDDIGYTAIVDNRHRGMIYDNEIYAPLELESQKTAYVKAVREDGKIDLTLTVPGTGNRVDHLGPKILELIDRNAFPLTDKSTPDEVAAILHCSKKDYKKAIGALYRTRRVALAADGTWHKA